MLDVSVRRAHIVAAWTICLLGVMLRFVSLTQHSFDGDEFASYYFSHFSFWQLWTEELDTHPPLYYSIQKVMLALGDSEALLRTPVIFALLAATTPIMIIYSRFGWDPSQTPLADMIFLWACLAGRRIAAVLSLCAAILIHATNIFLVPILVVFWFEDIRPFIEKITGRIEFRSFFSVMLIGALLAAIPISLWVGRAPLRGLFGGGYWHLQHLVIRTSVLIGDQFSGIGVYRARVGDPIGLVLHRVIISSVLIGLSVALFLGARGTQDPRITKLSAGVIASVIPFVIIAGGDGLRPSLERYALWMITPVFGVAFRGVGPAIE
jgi:hypothetical protein